MNTYTVRHYVADCSIESFDMEATSFSACLDGLKLLCFDMSTLVDIVEVTPVNMA